MKSICKLYANKIEIDIKNIYFSYEKYNDELTLVFQNETSKNENNNIIKSKSIICPICGESIRLDIINYKIKLSEYVNHHVIDNILLNAFENTQKNRA